MTLMRTLRMTLTVSATEIVFVVNFIELKLKGLLAS